MGDDYERAEAEYWEARGLGYSDEDIIRMDEWPKIPKRLYQDAPRTAAYLEASGQGYLTDRPETPAMRARREGRAALARESEPRMPINTARTAAELRALIAEATKTLAILDKTPEEPSERLTTFGVTFPGRENVYTYVALRISGRWHVSGRHFEGLRLSWIEIFERFDRIKATVKYVSTPVEFRSEKIN